MSLVPYSVGSDIRTKVNAYLAVGAASACAYLAGPLAHYAPLLPGFIQKYAVAPSALTLFGLMFFAFDRYLWRLGPIAAWTKVRPIDGRWKGIIHRTNLDGSNPEQFLVVIRITQTFNMMNVTVAANDADLDGGAHLTTSVSIAMDPMDSSTIGIKDTFHYPGGEGVASLHIFLEEQRISGEYFSSVGKRGAITATRVDQRSIVEVPQPQLGAGGVVGQLPPAEPSPVPVSISTKHE